MTEQNLILRAAQFAREAHGTQTRKYNGRPYVEHPARVASRVALYPEATEAMVAAAFLHDVLEDTQTIFYDLVKEFGSEVAALVQELTNTSKIDQPVLPRDERKRMDRERLVKVSREAKIIKLIDRIDNLRDMFGASVKFVRLYAEESLSLATVIGDADAALKMELLDTATEVLGRAIRGQ
jgi:(p)ppGpp synthase/HD superfamily hydrolase